MASSMDSTVAEKTATKCWELGETRPRWVHMETAGGELMGPHAGRDGSSLQAAGTQAPSRHAQDTGGQIQGDGKVHPHSNGLRDPQGRRVPEGLRRHAGQSRGRLPPLLPVLPQADGSQGGRAHSPGRHHHRHLGCTVLRGLAPVPYSHRPPGHGPQVQAQGGGDCPGGRLLQPQQKARPQAQGGAEGRGGEPAPEDHRGAGGHPGRLQQAQLAAGAVGAAGAAASHTGPPGLVAGPLVVQVHPGRPGAGSRGEGVPDQAPHGPLPGAVGCPRGQGAPGLPQGPALAQGQVQGVETAAGGGDEGQAGRERPLQELPALHEEPRPRPDQLRGLTLRPINYFHTLGRAGAATLHVPPTLRGLEASVWKRANEAIKSCLQNAESHLAIDSVFVNSVPCTVRASVEICVDVQVLTRIAIHIHRR
ncbi:collagen alpha-1(I) chain isoform X1 [Ixodes scapularis]|uniref:collagen alpha-1(I) chain isoform X1 n=1 Tax=Ixodes scapularis TaxID=6945 RepID=UPI001C37F5E2|nr:collagen alpha-1(I) chain isoform X1 [Ixodes scapularis]